MNDLQKARSLYEKGGYTCALVRGDSVILSAERGIAPLVELLVRDLRGYCAADKIVGKAAAMLYAYMGISAVYAKTISKAAAEVFDRYSVGYEFDVMTDRIVNRRGDGICPMEVAVEDIYDCAVAAEVLKIRFESGI